MSQSEPQPDQPIPPGDGNGDHEPPAPLVRITQISPIAAALAGGIDITITGSGFQPGTEVFFGSVASTEVTFDDSTRVRAQLPPATEPGGVAVAIVNPDGSMATSDGGFIYVATEPGDHAEVLSIEPANVIEDTETEVKVRGRNLILAYEKGTFLLRGPSRANVAVAKVISSRDEPTGIEELTLILRITATPTLQPQERMFIQVLASRRSEAQSDGIFESSRQMFVVLPNAVPVPLAYTGNINPDKPTLVVVAGRNLEGCSLDLGESLTIKMQRSEDDLLAGIVTVPEGSPDFKSLQISIRDTKDSEVARYDMSFGPSDSAKTGSAPPAEMLMGEAEPIASVIGLSLSQAPGQEIVASTPQDSAVFDLNGRSLPNPTVDLSNFVVETVDLSIRIGIINIVRLVPFFDGGGDEIESPVQAQVGKLFRVRGAGLLFALRVEIIITIEIIIIIGFIIPPIWDFGLFNEFPEFDWGIGSIVITIIIIIHIEIFIHFLIALVLPTGQLRVIEVFDLTIGIDFTITNNGLHLHFDPRFTHRVIYRGIFPFNNLFPCDGRFQLAEENGRTVFPDAFGGQQSFYFARQAGECCAPWTFDFELVRFTPGGPETTVQQPFNASFCMNAAPSPGLADIIITSEHPEPTGIPPRLVMTFDDRATLKCLARPVDAGGNPTGGPLQDVTQLGYNVEFYLDPFGPDVLDPTLIGSGDASPVLAGDNLIHARIWPRSGEPQLFTFWPGAISGFTIASFLARGLPPAVIGSNPLPVTVQNPTQIVVAPTLVFTDPQNPNVPTESPSLFQNEQLPVREIERYEPFEYDANNQPQQLDYVIGVKLNFPSNFTFPTTLRFKIAAVQMRVLKGRGTATVVPTPPVNEAPLATTGFPNRDGDTTASHFFAKLVQQNQEVTINVPRRPLANDPPFELRTPPNVNPPVVFSIAPNIRDEVSQNKLVPPGKLVADRDVMLLINLEETSGAPTATPIKQLRLAVRNDETYEEYLRVFPEVRNILTGAFQDFARNFQAVLPATGAPTAALLETKGRELWNLAVTQVQTSKDDRPLYWARLQTICALRAFYKRHRLGQPTVAQFEWPSRGLEQIDGSISFGTPPPAGRKAIVTGFDPFQLASQPDQANPSGVVALAFNNQTFNSTQGPVFVRSAIFPVRFKDFNLRVVENAVTPNLGLIVMLMTISQNGSANFYDVERWAARNRGAGFDNDHQPHASATSPVIIPPGVPFLESTLPFERVLTSAETLPGPTGTAPFVIDQSYKESGDARFRSVNRIDPPDPPPMRVMADPPKFRPEPLLDDLDRAAFTKMSDRPNTNIDEGSGDNFLSNELFYRVALARAQTSLVSGHLHIPPFVPATSQANFLAQRVQLLNGVQTALVRFLNDRRRLFSLGDVTFPNTGVGRTSATRLLTAQNETNEIVGVQTVEIDPPQGFALQTTVPTQVNPNAVLSLAFTFTPTAVRVYSSLVRVRDAAGVILFSAQLTGEGVTLPPAPVITSFDPTAGEIGDEVAIFGDNLDGATAVRIGTYPVSFTSVSSTQVIAQVMGPPRVGHIYVDTPSGTAVSSGTFRVIRPPREPP